MDKQPISNEPTAVTVSPTSFVIRVSIPSQQTQKAIRVEPKDRVWDVKLQTIDRLSVKPEDYFNYGFFYCPGDVQSDGKFLDDMRTLKDYSLVDNVLIELKMKHRVPALPKQLEKENTKKCQKRLLEYIKDNNVDGIKTRLAKGLDPNFFTDDGLTPLIYACMFDSRERIKVLIEGGAIIDLRTKHGNFKNKQPNPMANGFSSGWFTALHVAAAQGHLNSLQTLLHFGCSPDIRDSAGLTPLFHACANGHTEIVRWILIWSARDARNGILNVDVNSTDSQNRTPIFLASAAGNATIVHMLLEHGADLSILSHAGSSPLHAVCTKPQGGQAVKDCANLLLQFGCDKECRNKAGQTPAQIALMSGNMDLSDHVKKWTAPVEGPPALRSIDQIVQTSREQWRDIKKLMSIVESSSTNILSHKSGESQNVNEIGEPKNFRSHLSKGASSQSNNTTHELSVNTKRNSATSKPDSDTSSEPTPLSALSSATVGSRKVSFHADMLPSRSPLSSIFQFYEPGDERIPNPPEGRPPAYLLLKIGADFIASIPEDLEPLTKQELTLHLNRIDMEMKRVQHELDRLDQLKSATAPPPIANAVN